MVMRLEPHTVPLFLYYFFPFYIEIRWGPHDLPPRCSSLRSGQGPGFTDSRPETGVEHQQAADGETVHPADPTGLVQPGLRPPGQGPGRRPAPVASGPAEGDQNGGPDHGHPETIRPEPLGQ